MLSEKTGAVQAVPKPALNGVFGVLLAIYFMTGPIPPVFFIVNSFTNHPHYNWDPQLPVLKAEKALQSRFPEFYTYLKNIEEKGAIIESPYPFSAWYHLYQRCHKRRVMIGHLPESLISGMTRIQDEGIRFRHFIDIFNPQAVKKSGASFIIIHKDMYKERQHLEREINKIISPGPVQKYSSEKQADFDRRRDQLFWAPAREQAARAVKALPPLYGPAVFEDKYIQVFKVGK